MKVVIGTLLTRATATAFEEGDHGGLFMVNRANNGTVVPLKPSGNYVDNMHYTYNNGVWSPVQPVYWADSATHADFYFYYPYRATLPSVSAMPFSVLMNQGTIDKYKSCDLIIGSTLDVRPTESTVNIASRHILSLLKIKLVAGNGFTADSLFSDNLKVRINGIQTAALVDLSSARVTASGSVASITPYKTGDGYEAFVVPQSVAESDIITVTLNGKDYNLRRAFEFVSGKEYTCTITLGKLNSGVNVSIRNWDNDGTDYGGVAE